MLENCPFFLTSLLQIKSKSVKLNERNCPEAESSCKDGHLLRHLTQAMECTNQIQQSLGIFHILVSVNMIEIIHSDSSHGAALHPRRAVREKQQQLAAGRPSHGEYKRAEEPDTKPSPDPRYSNIHEESPSVGSGPTLPVTLIQPASVQWVHVESVQEVRKSEMRHLTSI